MNEIVETNKKKISAACAACFSALERYSRACDAFRQERKRIDATPFVQEEKERMVNKAAGILLEIANAEYAKIQNELEIIKTAAMELEALMDVGPDFQNTLAVVKTMGKDLPVETRGALIEPFKGQKKALMILKAAFDVADLSPDLYFKGLIFDAESRVEQLDSDAYKITVQPSENLLVAAQFAKGLEELARDMGIELATRFSEMVDLSAAYTAALKKAFGV